MTPTELIEAAAKAIDPEAFTDWTAQRPRAYEHWDHEVMLFNQAGRQNRAFRSARAAATIFIEACAKQAEDAYESDNLADRSPKHIAAAIRALAPVITEGK